MNDSSTENSDVSDFDEACSFARQFDETTASFVLKTSESRINMTENDVSELEDDEDETNSSSDDQDQDDNDTDNEDEDSDDNDSSLDNDCAAVINEVDLNNLPERINERIFQLLGKKKLKTLLKI